MLSKSPALFAFSVAAAFSAVVVAGCAKTSPAVGTWTGTTPTKSAATLTLAADGTGTVSVPPIMQSRPVTWKEGENKTINLSMSAAPAGGGAAAPGGAGGPTMPATLSDDGKSMTLQFPMASIQLTKTEGK